MPASIDGRPSIVSLASDEESCVLMEVTSIIVSAARWDAEHAPNLEALRNTRFWAMIGGLIHKSLSDLSILAAFQCAAAPCSVRTTRRGYSVGPNDGKIDR